jgi:hypothetical protein
MSVKYDVDRSDSPDEPADDAAPAIVAVEAADPTADAPAPARDVSDEARKPMTSMVARAQLRKPCAVSLKNTSSV